ncbi:hypothetical protein Cni_G00148 [Canna indica]|uniref:Malectin-like domain-containing protein n=1 Tax=Canna indica TaxID=4628 RepID=A0AAQ3JM47_9LILI|nr:hypothetical protein Cni_G00148 [Canna indica]
MAFWFFVLVSGMDIIVFNTVHAEQLPTTEEFISIDCGIASNANYSDSDTLIEYVSDDQFIETGVNFNLSSSSSSYRGPIIYQTYSFSSYITQMVTLRSFPDALRSCYVLKPVTRYKKYTVRAQFLYGNYDGKNSSSIMFDLHIDVNFWQTVNVTESTALYLYEVIVVALGDSVSVCLINTGSGTPFISVLELRPLQDDMYPAANTTQYLVNFFRLNVGPDLGSSPLR